MYPFEHSRQQGGGEAGVKIQYLCRLASCQIVAADYALKMEWNASTVMMVASMRVVNCLARLIMQLLRRVGVEGRRLRRGRVETMACL